MDLVVTALQHGNLKAQFLCPSFCLSNNQSSKSLMAVFGQDNDTSQHDMLVVYGI